MNSEKKIIKEAFGRHLDVVSLSLEKVLSDAEKAAAILWSLVKDGGKLLICGNGGSAADSQHLAAEWTCRYKNDRRSLPAVALTTDTSALTAIGNDYSFDDIFARQISAFGSSGDVLVAITTSGQSGNVLRAIDTAKHKNMKVIVLTGEKGRVLGDKVDVVVAVPSLETARIQEVHEIVYHSWCEYIDSKLMEVASVAVVALPPEKVRIEEVHDIIYRSWCRYIDSRL